MGKVRVSVEAFGERPLTREFDGAELQGKNVRDVLETMVKERWDGKDLVVSDGIASEMGASGGFAVSTRHGGIDKPVAYEPVALTTQVRRYEQQDGQDMPTIHLAVSGYQKVGYVK